MSSLHLPEVEHLRLCHKKRNSVRQEARDDHEQAHGVIIRIAYDLPVQVGVQAPGNGGHHLTKRLGQKASTHMIFRVFRTEKFLYIRIGHQNAHNGKQDAGDEPFEVLFSFRT